MIEVKPFPGTTYNPAKIDDFSRVICPPYDVISESRRNELYELHPENFVRVDYSKSGSDGESGTRNPYVNAGHHLEEWVRQGILTTEATPAIYVQQQEFHNPFTGTKQKRTGFTACLKLEEFEANNVRPHEITFSGPKKDRLDLLRATGAVTGQIFVLFPDENRDVERLLMRAMDTRPFARAHMDDIVHSLWKIHDTEQITSLCRTMSPKWLVIADGHHRYETALAFRDEKRLRGTADPSGDFTHVMLTFVSMSDPGLTILPIHRLIRNIGGIPVERLNTELRNHFDLEPAPCKSGEEAKGLLAHSAKRGPSFWMKKKGEEGVMLRLKPGIDTMRQGEPSRSAKWNSLDVSIFQSLVLKKAFGFSADDIRNRNGIECPKDPHEAIHTLEQENRYDHFFLMNPMAMEDLTEIVRGGERLPQKSTNFHPKVYSGLVMQLL